MKASELRIGNWVLTCTPGGQKGLMIPQLQAQVQGITLFHDIMFCHTPTHEGFSMPDKHTMGIPLTEEWLLKFGFKDTTKEWQTDKCFRIVSKAGTKFDYWLNEQALYRDEDNFLTHVYDVHQLQNLYFCLTGKELELTPSTV